MPNVKSATRVLELLEFFAEHRTPMSTSDVVLALGYPQSSVTMLLQTLTQLRYLEYDREQRRYFPTVRVSLLGSWITEHVYSELSLSKLVNELHNQTEATAILGLQNDLYAQYIQVKQTKERRAELRWYLKPGSLRPLARTAIGRVLLAAKPDSEVIYLVRRINALEMKPEHRISEGDMLAEVEQIREQGYAFTMGTLNPQAGVVACLLPAHPQQPRMAVGVGTDNKALLEAKTHFLSLIQHSIAALQSHISRDSS